MTAATLSWLMIGFWVTAPNFVSAREFTNAEGKKLEGTVIAATKDSFVIETPERKRITIPLGKVVAEDQAFIVQWRKANPEIKLTVTAIKERSIKGQPSPSGRLDQAHWKITIKNNNPEPVENLKLYYLQVRELKDEIETNRDKMLKPTKEVGTFDLEPLPAFGSIVMNTNDITVGSFYGTNTSGYVEKWTSDLNALNIEILWGKRPVSTTTIGNYAGMGSGQQEIEKLAKDGEPSEEERTAAREERKQKRLAAQSDRDGEKVDTTAREKDGTPARETDGTPTTDTTDKDGEPLGPKMKKD
jgi:hypothetical protein